ncbi:VOC family protein [Brucella sp. RRSP16]|uniref:VOC family protein n=1 Tax=Brucella sp. RRSP16 TaxID=3453707 RepID=UPI003FCD26B7
MLETAIYVQDVARAAQFYDRVFGFTDLVHDERVVAYDAGSATVLLLFKRGATLVALVLPGGTSIYFRDPDDHLIELGTPGIWRTF